MDLVDKIMAYESDELTNEQTIELFSELIKNGQAWSLQGNYGLVAMCLIKQGILSKNGFINWDVYHGLINV